MKAFMESFRYCFVFFLCWKPSATSDAGLSVITMSRVLFIYLSHIMAWKINFISS